MDHSGSSLESAKTDLTHLVDLHGLLLNPPSPAHKTVLEQVLSAAACDLSGLEGSFHKSGVSDIICLNGGGGASQRRYIEFAENNLINKAVTWCLMADGRVIRYVKTGKFLSKRVVMRHCVALAESPRSAAVLGLTSHGTVYKLSLKDVDTSEGEVKTTTDVLEVVKALEGVNATRLKQEQLLRQIEFFQEFREGCLRVASAVDKHDLMLNITNKDNSFEFDGLYWSLCFTLGSRRHYSRPFPNMQLGPGDSFRVRLCDVAYFVTESTDLKVTTVFSADLDRRITVSDKPLATISLQAVDFLRLSSSSESSCFVPASREESLEDFLAAINSRRPVFTVHSQPDANIRVCLHLDLSSFLTNYTSVYPKSEVFECLESFMANGSVCTTSCQFFSPSGQTIVLNLTKKSQLAQGLFLDIFWEVFRPLHSTPYFDNHTASCTFFKFVVGI